MVKKGGKKSMKKGGKSTMRKKGGKSAKVGFRNLKIDWGTKLDKTKKSKPTMFQVPPHAPSRHLGMKMTNANKRLLAYPAFTPPERGNIFRKFNRLNRNIPADFSHNKSLTPNDSHLHGIAEGIVERRTKLLKMTRTSSPRRASPRRKSLLNSTKRKKASSPILKKASSPRRASLRLKSLLNSTKRKKASSPILKKASSPRRKKASSPIRKKASSVLQESSARQASRRLNSLLNFNNRNKASVLQYVPDGGGFEDDELGDLYSTKKGCHLEIIIPRHKDESIGFSMQGPIETPPHPKCIFGNTFVNKIKPKSVAAASGLKENDIILSINGVHIDNKFQAEQLIKEALEEENEFGTPDIYLFVYRE